MDYFFGSHDHQFNHDHNDTLETLPYSIDWRQKGAVTEVKDQGHCNSCWTFSATGAIEGQYFRKTGRLVSLSEQNLVDCATHGNACDPSYLDLAYQYAMDQGIATEHSYPYTSGNGKADGVCKYHPNGLRVTISGMKQIPRGNEHLLQEAIATIGPISVAVDSSELLDIHSGIFHSSTCSQKVDHGVLVVGYGTDENGNEYYIIKNSWGKDWGENGYFRLARNQGNLCGVASLAMFPIM